MVVLEPDVNPLGSRNNSFLFQRFLGALVYSEEKIIWFQDTKTLQKASSHQNIKVLIRCNPLFCLQEKQFILIKK